eukprot:NODE_2903_length_484_cov_45.851541_g2853_i0.p1 GENE.NODE_2903_length_484_cov_45.851541_g2853_i0~~NODE_2903_length_484_cov_45.851541_g2853_i0.p1  ORF type:complete len:128 (-),score=7.70 NODE_2903_length_484_cov_45.851541_g2853_i0:56-439(-)
MKLYYLVLLLVSLLGPALGEDARWTTWRAHPGYSETLIADLQTVATSFKTQIEQYMRRSFSLFEVTKVKSRPDVGVYYTVGIKVEDYPVDSDHNRREKFTALFYQNLEHQWKFISATETWRETYKTT